MHPGFSARGWTEIVDSGLVRAVAAPKYPGHMDSSGYGSIAPPRELATAPLAPTILIVEDDPALRTLLIRLLREEGFQPLSAGHGAEMARVLETNSVDLILLDIMALAFVLDDHRARSRCHSKPERKRLITSVTRAAVRAGWALT